MIPLEDERNPVEVLAEEFAARRRQGEKPTIQQFCDRYPELADDIKDLFPALLMIEDLDASSGATTGSLAGAVAAISGPRIERLGDYRLLREVGRGGMGVVYEAEQESLGRRVALKILSSPAHADPKQLRRFEREARAAARLHHTNIVPVFGVGCSGLHHYYVMQFISGLGLDLVIEEIKRLRLTSSISPSSLVSTQDRERAGNGQPKSRGINASAQLTAADVARSLITGRFNKAEVSVTNGEAASASITEADPSTDRDSARNHPDDGAKVGPRTADCGPSPHSASEILSLSDSHRLFFKSVARIGLQAAEALEYANRQGTLHRDIKPSNLLLDHKGNVWMADFGLAKTSEADDLTQSGDILGTIRYMAPERFHGRCDVRSDVYSLGLTLYELMTLQPAYQASDRHSLIDRVLHEDPQPLRKLLPAVPRDLETIVTKAIARDPAQRYGTAGSMAEDLQRFLDDRPIRARRISQVERVWRWSKRNKAVASLLVLLATTLFGGFGGMAVLWRRAERHADTARSSEQEANLFAQKESNAKAEAQNQTALATRRAEDLAWQDYTNRVSRAYRELMDDNVFLADDLLHGCLPERRGWEWHYVKRLCHLERISLETAKSSTNAVVFDPDGSRIASASSRPIFGNGKPESDRALVELWESASGHRIRVFPELKGLVKCLTFSRDGKSLVAGSGFVTPRHEARLTAWDAATGRELWAETESRSAYVTSVAISPDGTTLAAGYDDYSGGTAGLVILRDVSSGRKLGELPGQKGGVNDLAFHPDGKRLVLAGVETIDVFDIVTKTRMLTLPGHTKWVYAVAYSPDGNWLASGGWDKTIVLRDAATGAEKKRIFGHEGFVQDLAFSPDSRHLASTSEDRSVRLWEMADGRPEGSFHGHGDFVLSVSFRPDGREIATGGMDGRVKFWDLQRSRQVVFDRHTGWVVRVDFHRDGHRVLSYPGGFGTKKDTPRVWDPSSGDLDLTWTDRKIKEHLKEFLPGSSFEQVKATSADGKWVAQVLDPTGTYQYGSPRRSEYEGNAVEIRDAATGQVVHTLVGHTAEIVSLGFSPDGRRLATVSYDRTLKLWDVETGREVFALLGHTSGLVSLAFSPDGNRIVTGGIDCTARVWDGTPLPANVLQDHEARYQRKVRALAQLKDAKDDSMRAPIFTQNGQWGLASIAYAKLVAANPEENRLHYSLILMLLSNRDIEGYRAAAKQILAKFGDTTHSGLANNVAWQCSLAPAAVTDIESPVKVAQRAMATYPESSKHTVLNTLGATLYRAGRFQEAIGRLEESIRASGSGGVAEDWVFLAMAHHSLGHHEEAIRWLEKVNRHTKAESSSFSWEEVALAIIRREAENMVLGAETHPESLLR